MADAGGATPQPKYDVINERRAGSTVEVERIEDERGTVALGDPDRRLQGPITLEQEGEDVRGRCSGRTRMPHGRASVSGGAYIPAR